jgi:HNH endonuclease
MTTNYIRMYREDLVREQDRRCAYCFCDISMADATFDHINPKSNGGRDRKENGCAACEPCNKLKGRMSVNQFKKIIKHPPRGAPWNLWFAHMRRRIGLASFRACRNIKRAAGLHHHQQGENRI